MKSLREHEKILPPAEIERRSFEIIEQELPHIFVLADEEKEIYRCKYCEEKASRSKL